MALERAGRYADVIRKEFVESLCPVEYEEFMEIFQLYPDIDSADLARFLDTGDSDYLETFSFGVFRVEELKKIAQTIFSKWITLVDEFTRATSVLGQSGTSHLVLVFGYRDPNTPSLNAEVNGEYFAVDQVYAYTAAGELFKDHITRSAL